MKPSKPSYAKFPLFMAHLKVDKSVNSKILILR